MRNLLCKLALAAALLAAGPFSAMASNGIGFSRSHGVIGRAGAGTPANFDAGFGYQFCPHFGLTAGVMGFSGLTSMAGVLDARSHILDQPFTPFVDIKLGYGVLGKDIDNANCYGIVFAPTAGLSWRRFDLGVGATYDAFNQLLPFVNLSYNIRL